MIVYREQRKGTLSCYREVTFLKQGIVFLDVLKESYVGIVKFQILHCGFTLLHLLN